VAISLIAPLISACFLLAHAEVIKEIDEPDFILSTGDND